MYIFLDTAVQKGKKLYAGRVEFVKSSFSPDLPSMDEAVQEFQKIVDGLSSGIIAGIESSGSREDMKGYLYTFICRDTGIRNYGKTAPAALPFLYGWNSR